MSTALGVDQERRKLVRLRVRADLGITPQKYEGKTHYVVKDPVSLRYYRFNEQEYFVVRHLDGTNTLDDAQKKFEAEFRPHRLTLEDLEGFAQQLLQAGLVQHESATAGKELYNKRRKQRRLQRLATWSNILYIKLPLFDPDKLLKRMLRYLSWIFTGTFFAASVGLMLSAVLLVTTHFDTFYERLPNYYEFFRWNTLLYTWLALGVVKVIHEFGHGLSCKAFGGECHEMGALFLCLSPCLYCNVSDSWTLPNKWRRIIISFAGIYVELVIAALATWVWWYTPGRPVINNVALCVMVLCSVSTVVFNANPLMRFDGYYILADWLEIPNLRDRSNRMLKNLTCEHALGMEVQPEPYMETWRKVLFVTYAVGSYIYRWVLTFSILYFLSNWLKPYKLGALSTMLAMAALGSLVGWPVYRLVKGLHKRGRLPDMKRNRVTISSAILVAILFAFFLLPLPISRVRQTGLVQIEPNLVQKVTLPSDGLLVALHVRDGQRVKRGQVLAEFRSPKLEADYQTALGNLAAAQAQVTSLKARKQDATDAEDRKQLEEELSTTTAQWNEARTKEELARAELNALRRLDAPCDGIVLGAARPEDIGRMWEKASPTPFCQIGDPKELRVLVPVPPSDYHVLQQDMGKVDRLAVSIHFPGRGADVVLGQLTRLPVSDAKEVPLQLTQRGGGPLAAKPNAPTADPNIQAPQSQQYLVSIEILNPDAAICPGSLAQVKIHCTWRSAAWWAWHKISSAFDLTLM